MTNFEDFLQAIKHGDILISQEELDSDHFKKSDEFGLKLIHWVSLNNHLEILKWILKHKCDIEATTENGWRAIHFAALRNHREIIKLLVEHYCELECKTNNNETPLDMLTGNCNREFVDKICPETLHKMIGLSMGLSCSLKCTHKFCLSSISTSDFEKGTLIGNGSFGKIYTIHDSIFSKQFIIKINEEVKNWHAENNKEKCPYILHEINHYSQILNHESIVKYYGGIFRKKKWFIFLDFMTGGSLEDEINKSNGLPVDIIARRCKDIINGINFLHENKIIHRDIKPLSILLDKNRRCKLIMSAFSRILPSETLKDCKDVPWVTFYGTLPYMAPEVINDESYSFYSDIWSVGASIVHMLTGKRPYRDKTTFAIIFNIDSTKKNDYKRPVGNFAELEKFVTEILNPIPMKRPTARKLLDYRIMQNIYYDTENEAKVDHKSYKEYYRENQEDCIDIITSTIKLRKIAAEIGFFCNPNCDHKFCISSLSVGNFQRGELIGRGYYGNTYKINELQNGRVIVMKPFKLGKNSQLIAEALNFQDKINKFQKTVKHERLAQYYGALKIFHKLYIFREFIEGNSIKNEILVNKTPIQEHLVKRYTKQVLEALNFLHQSEIIHRDVRTKNIFIFGNGNIKLADYGYSEFLKLYSLNEENAYSAYVSYLAPELIKEELCDNSVDIWSLGVAVHEMLKGRRPTIEVMKNQNYEVSSEWKSFISKILKDNPKERPTALSLMLSDFINS